MRIEPMRKHQPDANQTRLLRRPAWLLIILPLLKTPTKSKRQRGTGRVFRRGNVVWISYYLHGVEHRETAHTDDEQQARKFLRQRIRQVAADQLGARAFIGPQQERILVNELLDDLFADYQRGVASAYRARSSRNC
jgi:hypothetical protein